MIRSRSLALISFLPRAMRFGKEVIANDLERLIENLAILQDTNYLAEILVDNHPEIEDCTSYLETNN
jgi:hypothetical protein